MKEKALGKCVFKALFLKGIKKAAKLAAFFVSLLYLCGAYY